jgi:aminoglycoside phosphotransferase family enzyme/predicted kinase
MVESALIHRTPTPVVSAAEREQAAVVTFLLHPETHGGTPVRHIETHISHIFIAGPRTYKLKRAVRRNFVDYSTPEKRKALCQREIEVNIHNAPGIYLGVLPIIATPHGLSLGHRGQDTVGTADKAIDYVVEMATFDPDNTFDQLAANRTLPRAYTIELADVIAKQHLTADRVAGCGGAIAVAETIEQLATEMANIPGAECLHKRISVWKDAAEANRRIHANQLDARKRHGYVRRCHGDLHLGNICLFEGHPTAFDAIEFSDKIASTDILYDLAFSVMDLLYLDLSDHANTLLSRYLNITRDYSGLKLMPLFVSMRAAVRAMVAVGKDNQVAQKRLDFAISAAQSIDQIRPALIAVGGLSGSGKSTLAANISPRLPGLFGAIAIRSDVCRKRLFNVAPEAPLPESAYAREVGARVYQTMLKDAGRALRSGTSVILDATFVEGNEDKRLDKLAHSTGAQFHGIWLSLDLASLQDRIQRRAADASDATPAVAQKQWQNMKQDPSWHVLDASQTPSQVAAKALSILATPKT